MSMAGGFPYAKHIGATPQSRTGARQAKANQDRAPENNKAPGGNLDKKQKLAQAGETVPIVFAKRVNDKGGVWVAPPLLKTGSKDFVTSFLYSISQGEIASTPDPINLWAGVSNQALKTGSSITLSHIYKTDAQLILTSTCPISGDGLYCGIDSFSYLEPVIDGTKAGQVTRVRDVARANYYFGYRTITRGTGDTDNSSFTAQLKVYDNSTGNDVTTAYNIAIGATTTVYSFNTDFATGSAKQVGTIQDFIALFGYISPTTVFSGIGDGSGSFTSEWTVQAINFQTDTANPADVPYALTGVQNEVVASIYPNPDTSTITDFSSYADITFLKVVGNLYETPASGALAAEAEQAYIFYEQGVKVDLYSAGLSGGSYTVGASNQLVDLAMYLFKLLKRVDGANTASIAAPMNTSNMQDIAAFCTNYDLLFNGIISTRVNIIEYLVSLAPCFLLSLLSLGGQYQFRSLLPLNGSNQIDTSALTPAATFTEAEILPGSFKKAYADSDGRRDFIVSVAYRQGDQKNIGIEQTVKVRYSLTDPDVPVEQFDLTDFCAIKEHAVIFAKHELARRKHSTHSVSFQTPLLTTDLAPTDVIKIQRQRISNVGDDRTETEWYQVTKIDHSSSGVSTVEAVHFPVNGSSVASISDDVVNGTFTIV